MIYFSDLNGKTVFIEKMTSNFDDKILILDFDTQFTALKSNRLLSNCFYETEGPEIILPDQLLPLEIIDKIIEAMKSNIIIILDSLNGLVDYLNSKLRRSFRNYLIVESFDNPDTESLIRPGNNSIVHCALIFLKILFQSPLINKAPTILTSYISQRSNDWLIQKLHNLEINSFVNENHFERVSQSISLLKYDRKNMGLFDTIILNRENCQREFSRTLKLS